MKSRWGRTTHRHRGSAVWTAASLTSPSSHWAAVAVLQWRAPHGGSVLCTLCTLCTRVCRRVDSNAVGLRCVGAEKWERGQRFLWRNALVLFALISCSGLNFGAACRHPGMMQPAALWLADRAASGFSFQEGPVNSGPQWTERMVDKIWRKSWQLIENRRSLRRKQSSAETARVTEWVQRWWGGHEGSPRHDLCKRKYHKNYTGTGWVQYLDCSRGVCFTAESCDYCFSPHRKYLNWTPVEPGPGLGLDYGVLQYVVLGYGVLQCAVLEYVVKRGHFHRWVKLTEQFPAKI